MVISYLHSPEKISLAINISLFSPNFYFMVFISCGEKLVFILFLYVMAFSKIYYRLGLSETLAVVLVKLSLSAYLKASEG